MSEETQGPRSTETNDSQSARSDVKPSVRTKKERKPKQPLFRVAEPAAPVEPAPADKMKGAAKKAQPQQPDRPAWSLGGASPEWGPLDLTGGGGKLPPPGNYDAVIADVQLIDKPDMLRMIVSFQLDGHEATPAPKWALLASRNGPSDSHERPRGRRSSTVHRTGRWPRLLNRLATATRTPLEALKDPFDLPGLFIGKPVNLTVAHKERDGVAELVVRTIRPR